MREALDFGEALRRANALEHASSEAADKLARYAWTMAGLALAEPAHPMRVLRRLVGVAGIELNDKIAIGAAVFVLASATIGIDPVWVRLKRTQPPEQLTMAAARAVAIYAFWNACRVIVPRPAEGGIEAAALAIAMPSRDVRWLLHEHVPRPNIAEHFHVPLLALDARLRMLGEQVGSGERPVSDFRLTTARTVVDSEKLR